MSLKIIFKAKTLEELQEKITDFMPTASNRQYSEKNSVCVIIDEDIKLGNKKLPTGCYYGDLHGSISASGVKYFFFDIFGNCCQYIIFNKIDNWGYKVIDFTE